MSGYPAMTFDAAPLCQTPDACRFTIEGPQRQEADWHAVYNRAGMLTNPRKAEVSVRCTVCGKSFVQELRQQTWTPPPLMRAPDG